ncbi:MAG: SRPBCC family protein [Chloroflexi bacterium]|nr:SRPBCC family protein [Chloroflexota bacterium]
MAEYHFFTTWDIEAPVETVWQTIQDGRHYPDWWKYVASVKVIEAAAADGTGGKYLWKWKTALPYTLSVEMSVTEYAPPHTIESQARGELVGVGRWELKPMDGFTRVTYDWRVGTTKPWMNLLAPLARPAFSWNHNVLMDEGGRALAARLGVRLLASGNQTLS